MMEFVYPHTHLVAGVDEVGRGERAISLLY